MVTSSPLLPRSVIVAESKSLSSRMSSRKTLAPTAETSTISGMKNRAMSKSWMVMSRKMPPEAAM